MFPPAGRLIAFALLVALGRPASAYQVPGDLPPAAPPGAHQDPEAVVPDIPEGVDILTRGPVHEAFAEPVVYDPRPGPVIPRQPPEPVEELPPDQKPEGADVVWIPGYWAWDDTRNDFLWISGLWRDAPPGRQWIPGYWNQAEGGFQWVPGAWVPIDQGQDQPVGQYLPVPPASLEAGPSGPAPGDGFTWAPGVWYWQQARYVWRPGYWVPLQENWVWVPEHYIWTPGGCLFVPGYWDRTLARRGCLFAPVYFSRPIYTRPGFVYRPTIGLLTTALLSSLFVRPSYHQYYFGDYYAPGSFRSGIYPWFSFHQSRYGYDPLYSHYRAVNIRRDPRWDDQLRQGYLYRRDHVEARPPRTFVQQQAIVRNVTVNNLRNTNITTANNLSNVALARPIGQIAAKGASPIRFERLGHDRHQELAQQARAIQQLRVERLRQESHTARARASEPRRLELPRSPVADRPPRVERHADRPPSPTPPRPIETVQPPPQGHTDPRPEPRPDSRPHREAMRPRLGIPGSPGPEGSDHRPTSPTAPVRPGERREPPEVRPRRDRAVQRQANRLNGGTFGRPPGGAPGVAPDFRPPGHDGPGRAAPEHRPTPGVAHPAPGATAPQPGRHRENRQDERRGKHGPKRD